MRRSVYQERPVGHPDDLAGVWEAMDGQSGVVGLALYFTTAVPADRVSLNGTPEAWQSLDAMVYERRGPEPMQDERNFFTDSQSESVLRYDGGRLTVHWTDLDLDLRRGPEDTWAGRFHRRGFDHEVTLRRPRMAAKTHAEWFLGTWLDGDRYFQTCLHLGRAVDGSFVGWTDSLQELGAVRFSSNVIRPTSAYERFGYLASLQQAGVSQVVVNLNWRGSTGLPIGFTGTRQPNGSMRAEWSETARRPSVWRPVAGMSCLGGR